MPRIGATIAGFEQLLLTQLARTNQAAAESAFRIATGKQVSFPSDNPSAFLQIQASENQLSLLNAVHANVDMAATIGAGLQTTLAEIRTQLDTIRDKLIEDEDNTLTAAEKSSNQAAIDSAIGTLRSLARTSIEGKRFLDGSFDYSYNGLDSSQIQRLDVYALADDTVITGSVASAATQSSCRYTGAASKINSGDATFTLTGKRGATTISVTNNESLTAVRDRVNLQSHNTGIIATVSGSRLDFTTVDYGDSATIAISATSGTFATVSTAVGTDAVVTVNGQAIASTNIDGNRVSYFEHGLHIALEFQPGFTGAFSSVTISDDHVAKFSLSTRSSELTTLSLPGLFPELLSGVSGRLTSLESGGSLAGLGTNASAAIRVLDEVLGQLSTSEARVDAFADIAVASAENLLTGLQSNLEESLSAMNTVDEDAENALVSHYQGLSDNALAAIAILQQQHSSLLGLLRNLAGLE